MQGILKAALICLCLFGIPVPGISAGKSVWLSSKGRQFNCYYSASDKKNISSYRQFLQKGIREVVQFFGAPFDSSFDVYVYPDRHSLDSAWQIGWKMPDFRSECWMVASGISTKLDLISPKKWDLESCEHHYRDTLKTQNLITHELVHVYHGQHNASPDFSNTDGIDWFAEGLAVYASGQCDSVRIAEVRKVVQEDRVPSGLDNFWTGNFKYGLSGSMVQYIDQHFGRVKLISLLPYNKKEDILKQLNIKESDLIAQWKEFVKREQYKLTPQH